MLVLGTTMIGKVWSHCGGPNMASQGIWARGLRETPMSALGELLPQRSLNGPTAPVPGPGTYWPPAPPTGSERHSSKFIRPELVVPHRTIPRERNPTPYTRPKFLSARTELVNSTPELFAAWRDEDAGAIGDLLFGLNTAPVAEEELQHGLRPPPSAPPHRAQPDDAGSRALRSHGRPHSRPQQA